MKCRYGKKKKVESASQVQIPAWSMVFTFATEILGNIMNLFIVPY